MILHIASDNTKHIIYPFIKFVNQYFDNKEHFFILCSKNKDTQRFKNAITKDIFTQTDFFIQQMKKADKIILHGFWYDKIFEIYQNNPIFFEKTFWYAWGSEYYYSKGDIHKWFIKNIKHIIHFMREEFLYIKNRYDTNAKFYEYLIYDLHTYAWNVSLKKKKKQKIIQVGNSSDPSNNHLEVFFKLNKFKNIKLFCPLVYGDKYYKRYITIKGRKLFKSNIFIMEKNVTLEQYIELLNDVEIAFFNHRRQQSLGNITSLLIMGKKVYINNKITTWKFFQRKGIKIFNINSQIDLKPLNKWSVSRNKNILKRLFSKERIKNDLAQLFNCSLKGKK